MRITYDKAFKDRILEVAGLRVGSDEYLIDKKTKKPIKDRDGHLVKYDQFAGFRKGSIEIIKSDLPSLIAYSKAQRQRTK